MAKIDIITLTGFTAVDGSVVASGATIKFNSEFYTKSNGVMIRPKIYRNRELFDMNYDDVRTIEIPNEFTIHLDENDFYTLTPALLYQKVRDYLNAYFNHNLFEINIIE